MQTRDCRLVKLALFVAFGKVVKLKFVSSPQLELVSTHPINILGSERL